jgi:hypothetical protein
MESALIRNAARIDAGVAQDAARIEAGQVDLITLHGVFECQGVRMEGIWSFSKDDIYRQLQIRPLTALPIPNPDGQYVDVEGEDVPDRDHA